MAIPGFDRSAAFAARSQHGDHAEPTVRQVVEQHAAYVARSLRYLGIGEADLEDLAQDVFVVVHRRLADFEGRSSLRTWLYGICVRTALAYRRKAAARREQPVAEPPEQTVPAAQDADLQRQEMRRRLQRVLDELDAPKRAVFVLYEIERLPMKEVAESLGCPLQTAYSRHKAARKIVLAAFERQQQGESP